VHECIVVLPVESAALQNSSCSCETALFWFCRYTGRSKKTAQS